MKYLFTFLFMLMYSLTIFSQNEYKDPYLYFRNIPIHINTKDFKNTMKSFNFKYKSKSKQYNSMLFIGKVFTNTDTIIAEYSFKTNKVGKVTIITPYINYNYIIEKYNIKYSKPLFYNNNVIYNMYNGQIIISYDNTSIIITYFDKQGYSEINRDILHLI